MKSLGQSESKKYDGYNSTSAGGAVGTLGGNMGMNVGTSGGPPGRRGSTPVFSSKSPPLPSDNDDSFVSVAERREAFNKLNKIIRPIQTDPNSPNKPDEWAIDIRGYNSEAAMEIKSRLLSTPVKIRPASANLARTVGLESGSRSALESGSRSFKSTNDLGELSRGPITFPIGRLDRANSDRNRNIISSMNMNITRNESQNSRNESQNAQNTQNTQYGRNRSNSNSNSNSHTQDNENDHDSKTAINPTIKSKMEALQRAMSRSSIKETASGKMSGAAE